MEFRGLHDDNEDNVEQKYFEFGAHFRYKDLVQALKYLQDSQLAKKDKDKENSINIKNNSNYNEVYNQINKQLCQKMTDIIPPNKFIQSRNIKPLIQSLSQKITDIIQSQNNKKPMRHYVTKKKQINSKNKNVNNNQNQNNNNLMNKNIAKTNLENSKKNGLKSFGAHLPYKKKEISHSRNMLNNKKPLSKNNIKNAQFNSNKKNNLIPQEARHFTNTNIHNKINQPPDKNLNNNNNVPNKNNEKMFGTVIEEGKKINNNGQNTQTVQNIIVKSNINISFINNFNTTYLHKSKKKQKKIRSRNNQELNKLNVIENKIININNNIKIDEETNNSKICKNKIIENSTISKNNNNLAPTTNKDIKKKTPLISPKLKSKENNNNGSLKKKIVINNQIVKTKQNLINNFPKKEKQDKGNINTINKKRILSGNNNNKNDNNKKLVNNYIGRVKLHI